MKPSTIVCAADKQELLAHSNAHSNAHDIEDVILDSNLFTGSGSFIDTQPNSFDFLIGGEAHRLNEKNRLYGKLGETGSTKSCRSGRRPAST